MTPALVDPYELQDLIETVGDLLIDGEGMQAICAIAEKLNVDLDDVHMHDGGCNG